VRALDTARARRLRSLQPDAHTSRDHVPLAHANARPACSPVRPATLACNPIRRDARARRARRAPRRLGPQLPGRCGPELTRTPRCLRWIRTGYAYQPSALGTYRRRRAACPLARTSLGRTVRTAYRGNPGADFTLADLGFVPYLHALCDAGCEDLLEARPSLHAWFERCRARPTWQAVVATPAR
jgi:glutathione S-transferase